MPILCTLQYHLIHFNKPCKSRYFDIILYLSNLSTFASNFGKKQNPVWLCFLFFLYCICVPICWFRTETWHVLQHKLGNKIKVHQIHSPQKTVLQKYHFYKYALQNRQLSTPQNLNGFMLVLSGLIHFKIVPV